MPELIFRDTYRFSTSAAFYKKYGVYTKAPKGTEAYKMFWQQEAIKCLRGHTIDGVRVTGYHYFYLNYCPILRSTDFNTPAEQKYVGQGKVEDFPAFWDGDWHYFQAVEECEIKGLHLPVLKARGKGFSYKNAAMAIRDYYFVKRSVSYFLAYEKEFLIRDGVLSKCWAYMDFIDAHTAWTKRRMVKNDIMHKRASYTNRGEEIERGYRSEIIGVSVKDNPDKARGKRTGTKGKIYVEEAGKFPELLPTFEILRPSVEDGSIVTANIVMFGTGGTQGSGFEGLMELFSNPEAYRCYAVDNVWEEGMEHTKCGFFFPDCWNLPGTITVDGQVHHLIDKDGNSNIPMAKLYEQGQQDVARLSADPTAHDRRQAEHPQKPSEAALLASMSMFPKAELGAWKTKLMSTPKLKDIAMPGTIEWSTTHDRWVFRADRNLKPINTYPHKGSASLEGAVMQVQGPYMAGNTIPEDMYIICVDPYAFTSSTDNESLGAAYVLKNINNLSRPDDFIVAWYVGRPKGGVDVFNQTVATMAEYYNAKIGFETDRGEAFLSYFKHNGKLGLLAQEFQLGYNSNIPKSSVKREYGMHIGSGRNNTRKIEGNRYILKWLAKERGMDENGKPILNLHKIFDMALIEELIKYNDDGNFDRVSALRIGMYHMMELSWKNARKEKRKVIANGGRMSLLSRQRFV